LVIKASSSVEIRTLVDAIERGDEVHREAAVARLAVIGSRAVERLIEAYGKTTDRLPRVTILRTLEAIGDHRGGALAREAMREGGDVGVAAAGVLRALLTSSREASATEALDTLVASALDRDQDRQVRAAALDALHEMPDAVRARVEDALQADPDRRIRELSKSVSSDAARSEAIWNDAVEGRLPDDPGTLREVVSARAANAPLNALRKMIDAARAKEREATAPQQEGWMALRGSLHQALALRGSRVALYDLRETLESAAGAPSLPVSFLAALQVLGDRTCLEPLAAAWARTDRSEEHLRHQLASAFRTIARREKVTKGHTLMKRLVARWPGLLSTP
jgi:hypothetical protein